MTELNMQSGDEEGPPMKKRKIRLEDGRYMVFYTFEEDSEGSSTTGTAVSKPGRPPESTPDV